MDHLAAKRIREMSPQPEEHKKCSTKRKHVSSSSTNPKKTKGTTHHKPSKTITNENQPKHAQPIDTAPLAPLPSGAAGPQQPSDTALSPEDLQQGNNTMTPTMSQMAATETSDTLPAGQLTLESLQKKLLSQMKDLIAAAAIGSKHLPDQDTPQAVRPSTSTASPSVSSLGDQDYVCPHSPAYSEASSTHAAEDDRILSADEADLPEAPTVAGLFRASLFKVLLNKAKAVTQLQQKPTPTTEPQSTPEGDAAQLLFATQSTKAEEIPAPSLFSELITKQWETPGAGRPPLNSEKLLYNLAEAFATSLEPPKVDEPILDMASSTLLVTDSDDLLKAEDKRLEQLLRRNHQAAAWAVKAASSASFFNRATLLWLRHLQQRIEPENTRVHQDLNKLLSAVEYSADATLHAMKFAARSMGLSVVSRRVLWLKSWQADLKQKWKLASAPFAGQWLFGDALKPVLTESKDGKKKVKANTKPAERKKPYFRKQPFCPSADYFNQNYRQQSFRQDTQQPQQPRPYRGKYTQPYPRRAPFNNRGRPYRRNK